LNTILTDEEILEAQELSFALYEAGISALVIQDMGLMEVKLPPVPLIASTQTHNSTPDKVKFLEDVGFSRVILARELSLNEIRAIRKKTKVGLEVFVFGSLCVSFSGRCYMSLVSTGRSANRGRCSQPCRLPYELVDKQGNPVAPPAHYLCIQDLDLTSHLEELLDAGIDSFKIEGRLKDLSYVTNVTAHFNGCLERLLCKRSDWERSSFGKVFCPFVPDVRKTFNRSFTDYRFTDERKKVGRSSSPKFMGEPVGAVVVSGRGTVRTDGRTAFHNGDGLTYLDLNGHLRGFSVNRVEGDVLHLHTKDRLPPVGTKLYRNLDKTFMDQLAKGCIRRIPVAALFEETENGFALTYTDPSGMSGCAVLQTTKVQYEKKFGTSEWIEEAIRKSGATIFEVTKVTVRISKGLFLRVSDVNRLRREALEKLYALRNADFRIPQERVEMEGTRYPEESAGFEENVMNRYARKFYQRHGTHVAELALEKSGQYGERQVMRTKHCIRFEMGSCDRKGGTRAWSRSELFLRDKGHLYRVEFDCGNCEMKITYCGRRRMP
jgi:putative protease